VIRSEKRSGTTTTGRTELQTILEFLRSGDVLMVTRIDRLARSIGEPKQSIGNAIGDLIVSSTTLLAHSAEAVVGRFKKVPKKRAPVKAVSKAKKKARKSAIPKKKAKASKKSAPKKSAGKKAAKKTATKPAKKSAPKKSVKKTAKKVAKKSKSKKSKR
jgi:hypothetical protein